MTKDSDPRVFFAAERTMLAWSRTAIALLAFGFLIERSGLLLVALRPESAGTIASHLSFLCGVGFIILGNL